MRILNEIEVTGVFSGDFDHQLLAPSEVEETENGVKLVFFGIDELRAYQSALLAVELPEDADQYKLRTKINKELKKALQEYYDVKDAIRAYADALFNFIYGADAHRRDKRNILEEMLKDLQESSNDWELEKAIKDNTFELGALALDHRLTFRKYSGNHNDFDFVTLRDKLIKELNTLKAGLKD